MISYEVEVLIADFHISQGRLPTKEEIAAMAHKELKCSDGKSKEDQEEGS